MCVYIYIYIYIYREDLQGQRGGQDLLRGRAEVHVHPVPGLLTITILNIQIHNNTTNKHTNTARNHKQHIITT